MGRVTLRQVGLPLGSPFRADFNGIARGSVVVIGTCDNSGINFTRDITVPCPVCGRRAANAM